MNIIDSTHKRLATVAVLLSLLAAAAAFVTTTTRADSSARDQVGDAPPAGFMFPPATSDAASAAGHAAFAQQFDRLWKRPEVVLASVVIQDPGIDRTAAHELAIVSETALAQAGASAPEAPVWVAPRYDGTECLLPMLRGAGGPAEICASADEAREGKLAITLSRSDDDVAVYGLVPDGVERVRVHFTDGTSSELPVAENAYAAHLARATAALTFVDAAGATHKVPLVSEG